MLFPVQMVTSSGTPIQLGTSTQLSNSLWEGHAGTIGYISSIRDHKSDLPTCESFLHTSAIALKVMQCSWSDRTPRDVDWTSSECKYSAERRKTHFFSYWSGENRRERVTEGEPKHLRKFSATVEILTVPLNEELECCDIGRGDAFSDIQAALPVMEIHTCVRPIRFMELRKWYADILLQVYA